MAAALPVLEGPQQRGRGVQGQYVYAIVMVQPTAQVVARGMKQPSDFTRTTFNDMIVKCLAECHKTVVETATFQEPHASGDMHVNSLVRADAQYRWKPVAERLLQHYKVHVSFAQNMKTWAEGVVYFRVASGHKGPQDLDQTPEQWHANGTPSRFEDFLPRRWQQPGFVRATKLSNLAFYELCLEHNLKTENAVWAKADQLGQSGDKGLLAYCLDTDVETQFAKVLRATGAQEQARRATLTRVQVLEEALAQKTCSCACPGKCYDLQKQVLQKNGLDGPFQEAVFGALVAGRAKKRNLCLIGPSDCAKSFLYKGLRELYRVYERPDGGSYQLEDLLGQEVVFLNDFEFDAGAKEWMCWSYFKNFLEGGRCKVARPKNRGGNCYFEDSAPVFMTAPAEVKLFQRGVEVTGETKQMRQRIHYLYLTEQIPDEQREEVLKNCAHCSARLYLEGRTPAPRQPAPQQTPPSSSAPSPKRRRLSPQEVVKELTDLKALLDAGLLTAPELQDLKTRLLS